MELIMITKNTKLTFGKYKGRKLKNCPPRYLKWVSEHLADSDFHAWAIIAKEVYQKRKEEDGVIDDLEKTADDFLRNHGINPKNL